MSGSSKLELRVDESQIQVIRAIDTIRNDAAACGTSDQAMRSFVLGISKYLKLAAGCNDWDAVLRTANAMDTDIDKFVDAVCGK